VTCLGTNTLLALASDRSPDRLARFEAHVDRCAECRQLLGELAELSWMRAPRTRDDHTGEPAAEPLTIGSVVDRYVIIEALGVGGMGVVYTAYDPRLDRKIALKLLRPDHGTCPERAARLEREAQTLARLRHPNVVAVHDAGTFDDQVFVAMELVEGTTLREWLVTRRSWREIVDMFLQAAHGLSAAHAAGLVHRDFKPDNVLIGRDGRAQVADFGLARSEDLPADDIAGTPAYMSPEQRAGNAVSPASDQYSFCVALHEALRGHRPNQPAPAVTRHVPAAIRAAIDRGMHDDPSRRFPSMQALAHALRKRSVVAPALLAASIATCVVIAGIGMTNRAHGEAAPCSGAAAKLAGIWDASTREVLRLRFIATGRADATTTFAAVAHRLDAYAQAWIAEHTHACEATHVRGEQSQQLLDRRMGCLDLRLGELATRIDMLHETSPGILARTPAVIDALVAPTVCRSRAVLAGGSPAPRLGEVTTFDDGTLASRFGTGWAVSTDALMGGRSSAQLAIVDDGDASPHALAITGTVEPGNSPIAWAGAMFSPGGGPMQPADLSAYRYVTFSARGDGALYEVLLFSQSKGDMPSYELFEAGATWRRYRFALAEFDGVNPGDIKGLLFASNRAGPFALQIDQVRFE
jgi:aminoglycoside phosphotransferase (APT) family kinase protein